MKVICTRCGGTNIACEAIVNPNTGKIIDYLDESFMHANCGDCKEEVVITDVDRVKKNIDSMFFEFVKKNGKEPEYVECQIVWKDTGDDQRTTIKLSLSINDDDNDNVFYYCLVYSKENYYTENGEEYKIKTTVSLGDDCHNNICEWSITADIRWKNEYGIYKEYMCGCCHDEIIRHCPELAKFIPMHVCNHYGAPMYPVENGIYHTKNSDKSVVIEYLRISDKEYSKLSEAVDDKMYFKYLLFNLGIVDRWKRESDELIAELENLCGKKWVNPYKPEKERFTLTLTDEERSLIEERIEAGHYSTENIEKRREEAHKAKMAEKRAKICEQYDKEIRKAEVGKKVMLCVLDYGLNVDNVIYYNHNNTLRFNWVDYGEKITKEEFDNFVNNVDRSQLPEGIKFELK